MGYYSDVRILIEQKDFNKLSRRMKKFYGENKDMLNMIEVTDIKQKRTGVEYETDKKINYVYFGWDSIKWSRQYDDIGLIQDFISELDECHFMRMGETNTDVEDTHTIGKSDVECIDFCRYFADPFILDKEDR